MDSSTYDELEHYAGPGAYLICARKRWPRGRKPRHYCGSAVDVEARVKCHRRARPGSTRFAKLIGYFNQARIGWDVVRIWKTPNCRAVEIALKRFHGFAAMCPRCNPAGWQRCGLLPALMPGPAESGERLPAAS